MYEVVVARVRLEDEGRIRRAGVWTRAVVEIHRGEAFELARDDVVPPEFRIADEISVELVRLGAAEIPAFSSRVAEDTCLGKQRPEVLHLIGRFVVRDQRRTRAAGTAIEPEKDQHLGAANVVVDVSPVRIADVRKAVGAAAVVSVRQSNRRRAVRRGKLEGAFRVVRRKEAKNLITSEARSEYLRSGLLDESAERWWWIGHADPRVDDRRAQRVQRRVKDEGILRRGLALAQHDAVFAVRDLAGDDGDAKHIARGIDGIAPVLIDAVFDHVGPAAAVEAKCEIDVRVGRIGVVVTEPGCPQRIQLPDGELDEPVSLRQRFLRRGPRVLAAITAGGLL